MATSKAQDKAQAPELCKHDMDPATCAECNGAAQAQREKATGKQEAAPKAAAPGLPLAKASDLGAYQLTYHKPAVTLASGEVVKCSHHWGHEGEKAAQACLRKLAAENGVRIA
jgi:hypothetical protein